MGKGIDLARPFGPEHAQVIDDFKDQLLIVLIKRLGGNVRIPIAEADDTSQDMLMMKIESGVFHFEIKKKS